VPDPLTLDRVEGSRDRLCQVRFWRTASEAQYQFRFSIARRTGTPSGTPFPACPTRARKLLFAGLFLAPDVSILAYFVGSRVGAATYNFAHT